MDEWLTADMRIACIGSGEVGQTLATDLRSRAITDLANWDLLHAQSDSEPQRAAQRKVRAASDAADALNGAALVISTVTAQQCVTAAREAAGCIGHGKCALDLNSVSPQSKRDAATAVEFGGGRYVKASVMSPIGPQRIASRILLGGPHANAPPGED